MRTILRSRWGILFLLCAILTCAAPAASYAAGVKVTAGNLQYFKQPDTHIRYACNIRGAKIRGGSIDTKQLRAGTTWSALVPEKLERGINSTKRALAKKPKKQKRKALNKTLRTLTAQRDAVTRILGLCAPPPTDEFKGIAQSLEPYREQLTENEINHLLNKVAFGGSDTLRSIGKQKGLTALVNALVDGAGTGHDEAALQSDADFWADQELYRYDEHPDNKIWTTEALQHGQIYRFFFSKMPFKEWMILFWSAHFAVNLDRIDFSYSEYGHRGLPAHWALLKNEALGNFKTLAQEMVNDSAMAAWLNNDDNRADSPNQNFAREFLELFTLGQVDPVTGAPNYEQSSVVAATAFFSGFYEEGVYNSSSGVEERVVRYSSSEHDSTARSVFDGIPGAAFSGTMNWQQFPDHVLDNHPGAPRFIAERLFAQMVTPDVTEGVVSTLAAQLKGDNWELKPTLKRILHSQAMFSPQSREVCISSPLEVFTKLTRRILRQEPSRADTKLGDSRWFFASAGNRTSRAGQIVFEPPSVFAWKGACGLNRSGQHGYGEGWITAQSLLNRVRGCTDLMNLMAEQSFDFRSVLPEGERNPGVIAQTLAHDLFDLQLTEEESSDISFFLTHEKDPDAGGATVPLKVDLDSDYYINRKIPRAICLIFDLEAANEK